MDTQVCNHRQLPFLGWLINAGLDPNVCAFQTMKPLDFGIESSTVEMNLSLLRTLPNQPFWIDQNHSNRVVEIPVDYPQRKYEKPKVDACFTFEPNKPCAILTADCIPILLHARYLSIQAVAAIHGGWRGLSAGIITNTVQAIRSVFVAKVNKLLQLKSYSANFLEGYNSEGFDVHNIQFSVWLGAGISRDAFEVEQDVYNSFVSKHWENSKFFLQKGLKFQGDLYGLAAFEMSRLGISSILRTPFCTYSQPEKFYSYRRDRSRGRMLTLIYFRADS